jgi:hypothetical protein
MKQVWLNRKLWLHRLLWAPTLIHLRWKWAVLKVAIEDAQKTVYRMIDLYGHFHARPHVKHLESLLERIADLDKKIEELWSGQGSKKG